MLTQHHCVPCEGGTKPFTQEKINEYMPLVHDWEQKNDSILREFTFKNFSSAVTFMNKIAILAEEEEHHPDLFLHGYKYLTVTLSTHAIHGLSENDFIVAAKINVLYTSHR